MTTPRLTWLSAGLDDVPEDASWIDEGFRRRLDSMRYVKRYSETRLARWTAKNTIALSAGLPTDAATLARVVVSNAHDGAPEAHIDNRPIEAVIAMTDRADWAVCAVLSNGGRVGCDLELHEPRSATFVNDYFTPAERADLAGRSDPELYANAIWSAKESALKVLRTGLRRDTRSVEVSLEGTGAGSWHPLQVAVDNGRTFPGWWIRFGEFVLTCATERPTPAPESLVEPPPLAQAVPSHKWMRNPLR